MEPIILILICLSSSFVLSKIFKQFKIPSVMAPILIGIFLGIPAIKAFLTTGDISILQSMSNLGIIFLMFYLGLKLDLVSIKEHSRRPILIALSAFFIPFIVCFFGCYFLFDLSIVASSIAGFAISLTSAAISIPILKETNLLKSIMGMSLVGATLLDNIFGFLIVIGVATLIRSSIGSTTILLDFLIFFSLIYVGRYLLVPAVLHLIEKRNEKIDLFVVSLMMVLLMVVVSSYLGVDTIIGAFLAGVVVRYTLLEGGKIEYKEEREVTELIEVTTFGFLTPFFFIWIGFHFDILVVFKVNYLLTIFLLVAAFAGKFIGAAIGNIIGGGQVKEVSIMGWGMNIRGEMELVLIEIARGAALISAPLFSAIVLMSLITTLFSAIFFNKSIMRYKFLGKRKTKEEYSDLKSAKLK